MIQQLRPLVSNLIKQAGCILTLWRWIQRNSCLCIFGINGPKAGHAQGLLRYQPCVLAYVQPVHKQGHCQRAFPGNGPTELVALEVPLVLVVAAGF